MEEPRKYSRSISQLKSFTKCGEQFRLERLHRKDLPERPAPWTLMGIAVHEALMLWEQQHRYSDPVDIFYGLYDTLVVEAQQRQPDYRYWVVPPPSKKVIPAIQNYRQRGADQITTYVARAKASPWLVKEVERPFEIDLDGILVKGAVDLLVYWPAPDDSLMVRDIKTGTPKEEEDFRQLAFYGFVARELWDYEVYEAQYWFTKVDRPSRVFDISKFDKNFWTEQFKILDTAIGNKMFLPSPGSSCGLCSVQPWCRSQGTLEIGEELYVER